MLLVCILHAYCALGTCLVVRELVGYIICILSKGVETLQLVALVLLLYSSPVPCILGLIAPGFYVLVCTCLAFIAAMPVDISGMLLHFSFPYTLVRYLTDIPKCCSTLTA